MKPNIPAIRKRLAAATPGPLEFGTMPWKAEICSTGVQGEDYFAVVGSDGHEVLSHCVYRIMPLIAHAPQDLEALCDEVEALREMLARYWATRQYPADMGQTFGRYIQHMEDMKRLLG